jgi:hypothetical protein
MNSSRTIFQDQLRRRSEPFDALWACRTKVSDGAYLATLRSHALRVLRVISSLSGGGGNSSAWDGVYHNLHQALSLQCVGLYTDLYGDSQWCRPSYEYDKAVSEVKERFVAGQLVFHGAWNAFEIAGEALFLHGKNLLHRPSVTSSKDLAIGRFLGSRKHCSRRTREHALISTCKRSPSRRPSLRAVIWVFQLNCCASFGTVFFTGKSGPVTYSCRSKCSFRPPDVRMPRGFSLPMLNADGVGYRNR